MREPRGRAEPEEHGPPTAVVRLNHVRVPGALNRTLLKVTMGQDWIGRIRFKRTPRTAAARDRLTMTILSPAFGDHQIVVAVHLIKMWAFGTTAAGSGP